MAALASVGVYGLYVQEVFTGGNMISPRLYDEFVRAQADNKDGIRFCSPSVKQ
jgi:hypothetical protein